MLSVQVFTQAVPVTSQKPSMILDSFRPHSTIVRVRNRNAMQDSPAVFLIEASHETRSKVDSQFYELLKQWTEEHPNSEVIEIVSRALMPGKSKDYARESYVWVKDGNLNLNLRLVELGACNARTMLVDLDDEAQLLVDAQLYRDFKQKILSAEQSAKEQKLGIWK